MSETTRLAQPNGRPIQNGRPAGPQPPADKQEDVTAEQTNENIFLFAPNLIGYLRVVLAIGSLYFMPLHPRRCSFLYSVSCLLDALDGFAARKFQQSTRFGAVLDMITDRCTTTCLLVFLATAKPAYSMIFQGLISLDFASHYMHMYATLAMGGQGESHKNVSSSRSRIMNLYYTNKVCSIPHEHCLQLGMKANITSRPSSSQPAQQTNSSSSPSTSFASPRPSSRPRSSQQATATQPHPPHSSLARQPNHS